MPRPCWRCCRRPAPTTAWIRFKKCLACHTPDKGGRNLVGPNLWGVVGRKIAQAPGFNYSDAMKSHPGEWTWEELAKYLHSPAQTVPGNRMQFPGVKDNADLADLLAYMRKLSDTPAAAAPVKPTDSRQVHGRFCSSFSFARCPCRLSWR